MCVCVCVCGEGLFVKEAKTDKLKQLGIVCRGKTGARLALDSLPAQAPQPYPYIHGGNI